MLILISGFHPCCFLRWLSAYYTGMLDVWTVHGIVSDTESISQINSLSHHKWLHNLYAQWKMRGATKNKIWDSCWKAFYLRCYCNGYFICLSFLLKRLICCSKLVIEVIKKLWSALKKTYYWWICQIIPLCWS